jgi:hypothetical protein
MVTEEKNEEECDDFDEDENAAECTKKNGRGSIQSETMLGWWKIFVGAAPPRWWHDVKNFIFEKINGFFWTRKSLK